MSREPREDRAGYASRTTQRDPGMTRDRRNAHSWPEGLARASEEARTAQLTRVSIRPDARPVRGDRARAARRSLAANLVVLGVDPGTRWAGLVALRGTWHLLDRARLDLSLMSRDPSDPNSRVLALQRSVESWVARYQPGILAIEDPAHPRNPRTAQLLGRAVWACIGPAMGLGILVAEYRPGQIRRLLSLVRQRLAVDTAWSEDELAAAGAAACALDELGLLDL